MIAVRFREQQRLAREADIDAAGAWLSEQGEAPVRDRVAVVPFVRRALVPADPERVSAFRLNLTESVREAAYLETAPSPDRPDTASDSRVGTILGAACAMCGGLCCERGGTHAFLTAEEVALALARRPDLPADALLATYFDHLPDWSLQGSCVFNAETGCALPRTLRAGICNAYRCRGLAQAAELVSGPGSPPTHVAAFGDGRTQQAIVVRDGQPVPVFATGPT